MAEQWEAPTRERSGRDKDKRIRIVAYKPLERLLSERVDNDACTPTHVVNVAVDRYLTALKSAMPKLSTSDWCAILDALNGGIYWDMADAVNSLGSDIAESMIDGGLAEKWDAQPDLGQRIDAMSYIEKAAVVDIAERFWGSKFGSRSAIEDALVELGAIEHGRDVD